MSIVFWEGKKVPASVRSQFGGFGSYGGVLQFGDAGSDIANIVQKASPWDFLTGVFVSKPIAEAQAQAALAQTQADAAGIYQQQQAQIQAAQQDTIRTAVMVGGGILGVILLVSVLRRPARAAVGGYRKRSRSRSRR